MRLSEIKARKPAIGTWDYTAPPTAKTSGSSRNRETGRS